MEPFELFVLEQFTDLHPEIDLVIEQQNYKLPLVWFRLENELGKHETGVEIQIATNGNVVNPIYCLPEDYVLNTDESLDSYITHLAYVQEVTQGLVRIVKEYYKIKRELYPQKRNRSKT
jgi:hypothetical protein